MCQTCVDLSSPHSVFRHVARFILKYFPGKLLAAKLFGGESAVVEVENEVKSLPAYMILKEKFDEIFALSVSDLQMYVRTTVLSTPAESRSEALKDIAGGYKMLGHTRAYWIIYSYI